MLSLVNFIRRAENSQVYDMNNKLDTHVS